MFEFNFPDVGEGITEGTLVKWLVKQGDPVKKEQAIAQIETDKAVVDIPSPVSGTVAKLFYNEHDTVYVGKPLVGIDESGAPAQKPAEAKPAPAPTPAATSQPSSAPQASSSSSGIKALPSVRKAAKDRGLDLSSVMGTGFDGSITMRDLNGGKAASVQQFSRQPSAPASPPPRPMEPSVSEMPMSSVTKSPPAQSSRDVLATPSTRQLARDLGINICQVKGTGDHGMITKDDVKSFASGKTTTSQPAEAPAAAMPAQSQPAYSASPAPTKPSGGEDYIPLTQTRKAISRKMSDSWQKAVHYTIGDEADVTEIVAFREKAKAVLEKQGVRLTYLSFFVKAAVLALEKNPIINSSLDEANSRIVQKRYYNIGIAVDTQAGLMVPVIRNCESKTVVQIANEINDLASRARSRTLKLDEMAGGTFTVSSVGNIAGQGFTQIINYPEAAILGIGRIVDKPMVREGQVVPRKMLPLSITSDHRIIDGADASRFLQSLIGYLESPASMVLEMA